jgi:hypothetical protein
MHAPLVGARGVMPRTVSGYLEAGDDSGDPTGALERCCVDDLISFYSYYRPPTSGFDPPVPNPRPRRCGSPRWHESIPWSCPRFLGRRLPPSSGSGPAEGFAQEQYEVSLLRRRSVVGRAMHPHSAAVRIGVSDKDPTLRHGRGPPGRGTHPATTLRSPRHSRPPVSPACVPIAPRHDFLAVNP